MNRRSTLNDAVALFRPPGARGGTDNAHGLAEISLTCVCLWCGPRPVRRERLQLVGGPFCRCACSLSEISGRWLRVALHYPHDVEEPRGIPECWHASQSSAAASSESVAVAAHRTHNCHLAGGGYITVEAVPGGTGTGTTTPRSSLSQIPEPSITITAAPHCMLKTPWCIGGPQRSSLVEQRTSTRAVAVWWQRCLRSRRCRKATHCLLFRDSVANVGAENTLSYLDKSLLFDSNYEPAAL